MAKELGIIDSGSNGLYARFIERITFPIFLQSGKLVGFGGRTISGHNAKYVNSPATKLFNKSALLFGYNLARESIYQSKEIIITEGYLDVVMLHQAGFTNSVATLGTALKSQHIPLLKKSDAKVILGYDGDKAGMEAAYKDGSIWRTSKGVGKEKITSTYPLKRFSTYYDLCTTGFDKKIINELKPFNEKNRKKSILIEIDIEKFQSDFINIVLDMIHIDFYEKFLLHPESTYPSNADIYKRKLNSSIVIEAIFLGDMNNLLIVPMENGFTVNHFNKRFTANDLGSNYFTEWA